MTLIMYATKHGAVRYCAQQVEQRLADECELVDCSKQKRINISAFNRIIIGFSVHAGSIQPCILKFIRENLQELIQKQPGLFCSCLSKEEQAIGYFHKSIPAEIIQAARAIGMFGAIVDYSKMGLIEQFIMKRITKKPESYSSFLRCTHFQVFSA
jgi:menaquinone-dependent protoporphyrinogen oxidase